VHGAAGLAAGELQHQGRCCAHPPQALWQRLQQLRPDFFHLYLAYHHFRSKVCRSWAPCAFRHSAWIAVQAAASPPPKPSPGLALRPALLPSPALRPPRRAGSRAPACSTAPTLCCTSATPPSPTQTTRWWWCRWRRGSARAWAGTTSKSQTACLHRQVAAALVLAAVHPQHPVEQQVSRCPAVGYKPDFTDRLSIRLPARPFFLAGQQEAGVAVCAGAWWRPQ
jgi:hypothetical protein